MSRLKADPRHGDASGCGDGGAIEDAGAEVARGKPGSAELSGKVGGEEGACLSVLNVPALDECGQERAKHDGGNAGCKKVEGDGKKRAERLQGTGAGLECVWCGELQSAPVSVCLARAGAGRVKILGQHFESGWPVSVGDVLFRCHRVRGMDVQDTATVVHLWLERWIDCENGYGSFLETVALKNYKLSTNREFVSDIVSCLSY